MELDAGSGRDTGNLFGVALVKQYLVTVSSASSILGAASEGDGTGCGWWTGNRKFIWSGLSKAIVTVSSASSILGAASEDICSCLIVLSLELL